MIRVRLQISEGEILDTIDGYGLIYVSSDNRFDAPLKEFEKTSYVDSEGEHIYSKTSKDAFDYKVTWLIRGNGSLNNANEVISSFNSQICGQTGESEFSFNQVTFYNDYKKVKIVGTPSLISEATEFWRDADGKIQDAVQVEWTIRVSKPSLCDFNLE